jgi:hypothetical protein
MGRRETNKSGIEKKKKVSGRRGGGGGTGLRVASAGPVCWRTCGFAEQGHRLRYTHLRWSIRQWMMAVDSASGDHRGRRNPFLFHAHTHR